MDSVEYLPDGLIRFFAFSLDEVPEVPSHGKDFTLVEGCKQYLDSLAHLGRKVGSTT